MGEAFQARSTGAKALGQVGPEAVCGVVSNKVVGFYPGMCFRGAGASQVEKLPDMCFSS